MHHCRRSDARVPHLVWGARRPGSRPSSARSRFWKCGRCRWSPAPHSVILSGGVGQYVRILRSLVEGGHEGAASGRCWRRAARG